MKFLIVLALTLCSLTLVATKTKKCTTSSECEKDECCMQSLIDFKKRCEKRSTEGEYCYPGPPIGPTGEVYVVLCPCVEGYECKGASVMKKKLVTTYNNATCVKE